MPLFSIKCTTGLVTGVVFSARMLADPGVVLFNNSKVSQPVFYADGSTKINSANYVAQLFYSTDGTSFSALSTPAPFNTVPARAGYWSGNTKNLVFPEPIHDGQALTLKVAVWDSTLFPTWDDAARYINGLTGISPCISPQMGTTTFAYTTPLASDLGADAAYIKNFKSFNLTKYTLTGPPSCPEPSAVALGILGGGLLLWRFRASGAIGGR